MKKPVRMVAGAPVKHAPVSVSLTPLESVHTGAVCGGCWTELRSDGSELIVCDLTSALWRAGTEKAER